MGATSERSLESEPRLTRETQDLHRAIARLMEEFEAIDWYQQRIHAARDPELREILRHYRAAAKERAAMLLEWFRCQDVPWDEVLRQHCCTHGPNGRDERKVTPSNGSSAALHPADGWLKEAG